MRALIVCQYFPPEITAGATRLHAFAAGLTERGHEVEVICAVPNHPAGVIAPGYGRRLVVREDLDGFKVRHVWVHATPSKTLRSRLLNYASFAASSTFAGLATRRADVILASSPPLSVGSVGETIARRHRAPWILDVRDLWPDAAVALEQVGEGRMLEMASRLERRLYRTAAAVTVTTKPWRHEIESRGGAGKVTVIPNGTTPMFLSAGAEPADPTLLGEVDGRFRWMFAGNIGLVAGLETAIEAARQLGDGFQLVLLGDGPRREELERLASGAPLGSVSFLDAVPPERAARMMRAADALLVSRAPIAGLDGMVLSKLYDCCAVSRPIVVMTTGETRRLAEDAGAALSVPPGDSGELVATIRRLRDDDGLARELAGRARDFAEQHTRELGVEALGDLIERVAQRG